jgi:hypothetical protein
MTAPLWSSTVPSIPLLYCAIAGAVATINKAARQNALVNMLNDLFVSPMIASPVLK